MLEKIDKHNILLKEGGAIRLRDTLLYDAMPTKPYFTSNFKQKSIIAKRFLLSTQPSTDKERAQEHDYIQTNYPNNYRLLVADIDYSMYKALKIAITHKVVPNLIIKNKDNDRAHFVYLIDGGCNIPNGDKKSKAYRLFNLTQNKLYSLLKADKAYPHHFFKNPWNSKYEVYASQAKAYVLKELNRALPELTYLQHREMQIIPKLEDAKVGERNRALFYHVRFEAYKLKKYYPTYEVLFPVVYELTRIGNSKISHPLPEDEVINIAEGISRFVNTNDVTSHKKRGSSNIDSTLDLHTKQALSACRTHKLRKANTIKNLRHEYKFLSKNENRELGMKEFIKLSASCKKTIEKYWQYVVGKESIRNLPKNNTVITKSYAPVEEAKSTKHQLKFMNFEKEYKRYLLTHMNEEPSLKTLLEITTLDAKTIRKYLNVIKLKKFI